MRSSGPERGPACPSLGVHSQLCILSGAPSAHAGALPLGIFLMASGAPRPQQYLPAGPDVLSALLAFGSTGQAPGCRALQDTPTFCSDTDRPKGCAALRSRTPPC